MPKTIKVPQVIWVLGDPIETTSSGVTTTTRPLYQRRGGKMVRVGDLNPDYAADVLRALESGEGQ